MVKIQPLRLKDTKKVRNINFGQKKE